MNNPEQKKAWYKQPLVLMIIAIPLSAVFGGISMIYLAITTDDGLVKDDYYQYGKQINLVLERDIEAKRISLAGKFDFQPVTGIVSVQLTTKTGTLPATISLEMLHATRAGQDQQTELALTADKEYHGLIKELVPGRWYVQLTTSQWRLNGELQHPGQTKIEFTTN
ncbi:MAG: FixH family protein [Sulfuriflexus sp.]|nr:FixH family protein [Sulfuriflexus sp.]